MMVVGEYYGATASRVYIESCASRCGCVYERRTELHPNRVKEWAELIFAVTRIVFESRIKVDRKARQQHGSTAVEKVEVWPRWQRPPPGDRQRNAGMTK